MYVLTPGGKVAVGDWSRPSGNVLQRGFMNYHWYCCDVLFHIIGSGQHVHAIWDIPQWYVCPLFCIHPPFCNMH